MNRLWLSWFGMIIATGLAAGQSVYTVPANSGGNTLVLTVANESGTIPAASITVRPERFPACLHFTPAIIAIGNLAGGSEVNVAFTFSVDRRARPGGRDTVVFLASDGNGTEWKKTIIVRYAGPQSFALEQNYPNPFNPLTTICYALPAESRVELSVYDLLGRKVITLVDQVMPTGFHDALMDGSALASGIYLYRLQAGAFVSSRKLVLLR